MSQYVHKGTEYCPQKLVYGKETCIDDNQKFYCILCKGKYIDAAKEN